MEPLPSDDEHLREHMAEGTRRSAASRRDRHVAGAVCGVVLALALVWTDVAPGGWTLRGLVTPHAVREARARALHRWERLALFRAETPAPGGVIFLGSSTIERFPLAELFPGALTVDRGIGDEPLAGLLERLDASLPPSPAGAVLYLGSVDLRRLGRSPAEVAQDAGEVLDRLEQRHPGLAVAVLGVLPDRSGDRAVQAAVERANALLAAVAAARGADFVETHRPPLRTADGRLAASHAADLLHLSGTGYVALARRLVEDSAALAAHLRPAPGQAPIGTPYRSSH